MATPYVIQGSSMLPLYPHGTLILVKPITPAGRTLRSGTVVLIKNTQNLPPLAHRIVRVSKRTENGELTYLVQGDNVPQTDGWIAERDIIGKVVHRFTHGQWRAVTRLESVLGWRFFHWSQCCVRRLRQGMHLFRGLVRMASGGEKSNA